MVNTLIFLTDDIYFHALSERLTHAGVSVELRQARNLDELEHHIIATEGKARLIAYATPHVVPRSFLDALAGPAYNFHPGPPKYPGVYPSVWALLNNDTDFAVTCHEMHPKVDSGPIVGMAEFRIEPQMNRLTLDQQSVLVTMDLFTHLAPALADVQTPLPKMGVQWWLRTYTRKDFAELCQISADISKDEFDHLLKAVGEGPDHALNIQMHGRKFTLKYEGET